MPVITDIQAFEVLDSRGNPTLEVEVFTASGAYGRGMISSGATIGDHEAAELRDGDSGRYGGKGLRKAIGKIETEIKTALAGKFSVTEQTAIDRVMLELDETRYKTNLGANSILATSVAVAQAGANHHRLPLYRYLGGFGAKQFPLPMLNAVTGGGRMPNGVDFGEFMVIPVGAGSFSHSLQMGSEFFHALKSMLQKCGLAFTVGDEGGYSPNLGSNREALELIVEAIKAAGYRPGGDLMIAIDVAAPDFYNPETKKYDFPTEGKSLTSVEMVSLYEKLAREFPIISIEDALDAEDWDGYRRLTERLGQKVQLVGDDLFATDLERLVKGIRLGACNCILIKMNQSVTLTRTFEIIETAKRAGFVPLMSHRAGETEDFTIAEIALAVNAGQVKTGAPSRSDRTAKYNRLLKLEKKLGADAHFAGKRSFFNLGKLSV
jgi:enolase